MIRPRSLSLVFAALLLSPLACSSTRGSADLPVDDASAADATQVAPDADAAAADAGSPDAAAKAAACASSFGSALTAPYGRIDGTVLSVIAPGNEACAKPNSTHVVLQVTMSGAAYRMVVNVKSDTAGDPNVHFLETSAPLPSPAWSEGWHADAALDYVTSLGVHTTSGFATVAMAELSGRVINAIPIGANVSVYASTSGGDSAHLIHRNAPNQDGAIVIDPTGPSPTWLLFHFTEQTF